MKTLKTTILVTATAMLGISSAVLHADEDSGPDMAAARAKKFDLLDKNADGCLSKEESMATEKNQQNPERAAKGFERTDKDANGSLSKKEFVNGPKGGKAGEPE